MCLRKEGRGEIGGRGGRGAILGCSERVLSGGPEFENVVFFF